MSGAATSVAPVVAPLPLAPSMTVSVRQAIIVASAVRHGRALPTRRQVRPPDVTVPAREAVRPSHLLCALEEEAVVFFVAVVPYGMGPTWK